MSNKTLVPGRFIMTDILIGDPRFNSRRRSSDWDYTSFQELLAVNEGCNG